MWKNKITIKNDMLDRFMSYALRRRVHIQGVLNNKWSETTGSIYTILRDHTGNIYELAISDHPGHSHRYPMKDFVGSHAPLTDLRLSMKARGVTMPGNSNVLSASSYYSITACRPYHLDPRELIGRRSSHLAFMTDSYRVKDAELWYDGQVLALTYADEDGAQARPAIYVNYDPIKDDCTRADIAVIQYLKHSYDVQTARRIYYHDDYRIMSSNSNEKNDIERGHVFESDGATYVLRLKTSRPTYARA